jgi:hypothetical protein
VSAGESGDVQAEVHIEVTGASSLDDAAKSAQDLSDGLDEVAASAEAATGSVGELGGELDDLGAAAPGIEADGEAIGHIRDEAAGASPAVAALAAKLDALNSGGRKPESGGMMQTLTDIRAFMADMERGEELTIFKGMQGGFGIKPPAEQIEDELGGLFGSPAGPATSSELEQQLEALEREMGTFETDAAKYLHTVQDIQQSMAADDLL